MSRILGSKFTLRHLVVVAILIATLAISAAALAGARSSHGQFAAGSIRMSSSKSNAYVSVDSDTVTKVLRTSFKVPSGKTADVQATFTGTFAHNIGTYAYCFGAFTLDNQTYPDATFQPGQVQLFGGATSTEPDQLSLGMTGYRTTIGPGTHFVNVYISPAYAGCTVEDRALNVLVNIR